VTSTTSPRARPGRRTLRPDAWWAAPLATFVLLSVFVAYSIWAVLQNAHYYATPYISPIYTPCLAANCGEQANAVLLGSWWRWSPALVVAGFPVAFRLTCYYYRKAYYRAFWLSPPACAVAEPHRRYTGETRLPLLLQNLHRYFWYAGLLVAVVLTYDAVRGFHFPDGWGVGLGSLVLSANVVLFWLYCLSCHSCRHIVGGRLNHFSRHRVRYRLWQQASVLNARHGLFAWLSLPAVVATDLYVRLLSMGVLHDPRLL
jgi:hypothetical protein